MLSQLSSKRVKSVKNFLKIGRQEMMEVLRVDEGKMCIDLSKKGIKSDTHEESWKRYKHAKQVHTIMRHVALTLQCPLEKIYDLWCWDLYDIFGHAYDAFRIAVSEPETVFSRINIPQEHQDILLETIKRKIASNPIKIRIDFALTCYSYDGIDVIRLALLTAKHKINDADWNLEFRLIAPPNYRVEVQTHNKAEGEAKLLDALKVIKQVIKKNGGHFKQKSEAVIVNQNKGGDDVDVADLIESMKASKGHADDEEEDSDVEEDNDEGMGDVDFNEEVADAASDDEEEEKKE